MTNNWTDLGNSTLVVVMGANPSENHPACMAHINRARAAAGKTLPGGQTSNKPAAELIVIDPRKTRTAAQADRYIRIRPGTDIAFINGVVRYIIEGMEAVGTTSVFTAERKANWTSYLDRSSDLHKWKMDNGSTDGTGLGRSKYTDARLLVNAAGTDYQRSTQVSGDGASTLTALPKFGTAYNASGEDTVFNKLRAHVGPYDTATVADICECTEADIVYVAEKYVANSRCSSFASAAPTTIVGDPTSANYRATTMLYAMGLTQHTCGSQNVKSFATLQLLLGNPGRAGGGINALRGIHNVQGSTDMGLLYHLIPGYSANPSVQPYEDTDAYGKYIDALWGGRLHGGVRAFKNVSSGAGETIKYVAQAHGVAANDYFVEYVDPGSDGSLTISVVSDYPAAGQKTVRATLAYSTGAVTSTANDVAAAVNASAAASALVGAIVTAGGATIVAAMAAADPATRLAGGVTATYSAAYPVTTTGVPGNLQQMGFYSMTRKWFGDTSYIGKADVDRMYSLWPKVNGTNHIQMFRNMADIGSVASASFTFALSTAPTGANTFTVTKKGIKAGTVVVKDVTDTTTYVEGVDYKVSYPTHVFTRITTGSIADGEQVHVSYDHGIRAAVVWGQNPAITEPNQSKVREGLYNLDTLVCVDVFATETAMCDRKGTGVTYLLPSCSYVEKAGSATNSGRVLQWRYAARPPRGNSRSDLFLLFKMAKALDAAGAFSHFTNVTGDDATTVPTSGVWSTLSTKKNGSVYRTLWKDQYSFNEAAFDAAATAVANNEAVAGVVYAEMCSKSADGGTLWICTEAYASAGVTADSRPAGYPDQWSATEPNRAKSRIKTDAWGTLAFPRWGFAWLVNRRVLYNHGDIWRAGIPGTASDESDSYQTPDKCGRLFVPTNSGLQDYADGNYRTIHRLADVPIKSGGGAPTGSALAGRFPWHTEPYESPREDLAAVYGYNSSGTAGNLLYSGTPRGTFATYPLVLTTIRCVEHFQGGPITRNNPANHEAEPEPWIEINSVDARKYGIEDGSWVKVISARTDGYAGDRLDAVYPNAEYGQGFRARVGVGLESNQRVAPGVVAIPWHWGEEGLSTGSRANDVCIDAMDANTTIPEYKACLCRIVPMA